VIGGEIEPLRPLSTAQIGRCGELLVQYRLLSHGVESAPLTTDSGIDLVAYSPLCERAFTIQVKSALRPKQAGGHGRLTMDWWLREDSPAELVALTDLSRDRVWLFSHQELDRLAQQRSSGRLHFYFYIEGQLPTQQHTGESFYVAHLLENRIAGIFTEEDRNITDEQGDPT
jgi:hypothetical protein